MNGLLSGLSLSCEHATLLLIKREENKINRIEKIQLWIHTSICGLCKEFDGQNDFINHHLEIHFHNKQDKGIGLCNEDKKSMKKALLESE